jgi:protein-tyrosine phosphatase
LPFARSCTFFVVPLTLVAMLSGCGTTDTKPGAATATAAVAKPGQSLGIESLPNLRDLGGYKTSDGATVAGKLVYRSSQLTDISEGDMKKLDNLNLKTDLDLRTAQERNPNPDQLPPGVNSIWLNVLANAALGGGKAEAVLKAMYRQFITLPSANKSYSQLFLTLADQKQLPALFHCTGGKDRTGWAAAAFLTLLGVPKETVMQDYLRTNDYVLPAVQKANAAFVQAGGDPSIPSAIQGAKKEYLEAAFDEMSTKYGTIEQYFSEGLGIDASQQKALRGLYLGQR